MKPVALVVHPDCGRHDTGWRHPEHMGRLPAIVKALHMQTPAFLDRILQVEPPHATVDSLLRVHTPEHVAHVRAAATEAAAREAVVHLDADTVVSAATWDAALAAAGAAVEAAALVARGEANAAFALTRPPGHHATPERAMGFCLFNNVAVAARALQAEHGVERVMIVDVDVHHGNGTQDAFLEDGSVYFLSTHVAPHYPGTGGAHERGVGAGQGTTRNVPLPAGTGAAAYAAALGGALDAALAEFSPDFLLLSVGLDCLAGDPLGGLLLEPDDLHRTITETLAPARAAAGGRIAAVLEGGYAVPRLGPGAVAVLRALAGMPSV